MFFLTCSPVNEIDNHAQLPTCVNVFKSNFEKKTPALPKLDAAGGKPPLMLSQLNVLGTRRKIPLVIFE